MKAASVLATLLSLTLINLQSQDVSSEGKGLNIVPSADSKPMAVIYQQSHALLMGNVEYDDPGWGTLDRIPLELEQVRQALEAEGFVTFGSKVHLNLTERDMKYLVEDFIDQHGYAEENRVLIFYSGHGATLTNGVGHKQGYLVPIDAPGPGEEQKFLQRAISMDEVVTWAKRINAKHALFCFDSCFSGSIFTRGPNTPTHIELNTNEPARQFLTAGKDNETVPAISAFTPYFVRGIRGDADRNPRDGYVTGGELGEYVRAEVAQAVRNHVQFDSLPFPYDKGDIVFKVRPAGEGLTIIPDELRNTPAGKVLDVVYRSEPPKPMPDPAGSSTKFQFEVKANTNLKPSFSRLESQTDKLRGLTGEVDSAYAIGRALKEAYLYCFVVSPAGEIKFLFPERRDQNPLKDQNRIETIPAGNADLLRLIGPPAPGIYHLYAVFSQTRWRELEQAFFDFETANFDQNRETVVTEFLNLGNRQASRHIGADHEPFSETPLSVDRTTSLGSEGKLIFETLPLESDGHFAVMETAFTVTPPSEMMVRLRDKLRLAAEQPGSREIWQDALSLAQQVRDETAFKKGPEDPGERDLDWLLGRIHLRLQKWDQAKDYLTKAAESYEKLYGSYHMDTLGAETHLAEAYSRLNANDEAKALVDEVAIKSERSFMFSSEPQSSTGFQTVEVFFATDRKPSGSESSSGYFGSDRNRVGILGRGSVVTYGSIHVSIPLSHRMGQVETPKWYKMEFSADPQKHVTLMDIEAAKQGDFFAHLRKGVEQAPRKSVLVFIHGYNVSFADAIRRTAQLAYDASFAGVPFAYSWPSQGVVTGYAGDQHNAQWSESHLAEVLLDIQQKSDIESLHIIAHGMGVRVLLGGLSQAIDKGLELKLENVILAAPDIDADLFSQQVLPKIQDHVGRFTIYVSAQDKAIAVAQQINGTPRLGLGGEAAMELLRIRKVDLIDVSAADTSNIGHSYFGSASPVVSDLFQLLEGKNAEERALVRDSNGKLFLQD